MTVPCAGYDGRWKVRYCAQGYDWRRECPASLISRTLRGEVNSDPATCMQHFRISEWIFRKVSSKHCLKEDANTDHEHTGAGDMTEQLSGPSYAVLE